MSPVQKASRLRDIGAQIWTQRHQVIVAALAVRGFDQNRKEGPTEEQIEAVSELLQDIARRLDERAGGIIIDAEREEIQAA